MIAAARRLAKETHAAGTAWLDAYTTRRAMLPAYLMVIVALSATVWIYDSLAQQRADDAIIAATLIAEQRAADAEQIARDLARVQCLAAADSRQALRTVLLAITAEFPTSDSAELIVGIIRRDLPEIDPAGCLEAAAPATQETSP